MKSWKSNSGSLGLDWQCSDHWATTNRQPPALIILLHRGGTVECFTVTHLAAIDSNHFLGTGSSTAFGQYYATEMLGRSLGKKTSFKPDSLAVVSDCQWAITHHSGNDMHGLQMSQDVHKLGNRLNASVYQQTKEFPCLLSTLLPQCKLEML